MSNTMVKSLIAYVPAWAEQLLLSSVQLKVVPKARLDLVVVSA